jgi:hypothetical protein
LGRFEQRRSPEVRLSGDTVPDFSPILSTALTFFLGLGLAMIQRFILKAQRVAALGGDF